MVKPEDLASQHRSIIESMTDDQRLAMAREILACQIRNEAKFDGLRRRALKGDLLLTLPEEALEHMYERVSRKDSLGGVLEAEAAARNVGALPKVDFFLPIENDLPTQAI